MSEIDFLDMLFLGGKFYLKPPSNLPLTCYDGDFIFTQVTNLERKINQNWSKNSKSWKKSNHQSMAKMFGRWLWNLYSFLTIPRIHYSNK